MQAKDGFEEQGRSLRLPLEPEEPRGVGLPFSAMAEALRANAEALQRIDATQKKIAESLEKGEKSAGVVASTRALNETFRGLGEIQKGLLDAVTKGGGRSRGLPFAVAAIAILAALLGFLVVDRVRSDRSVDRGTYEDARARIDELQAAAADARVREQEALSARRAAEDKGLSTEAKLAAALAEKQALLGRMGDLEAQAKEGSERLAEYVRVKETADRVGLLELESAQWKARAQSAEERLERSEKERERLATLLLDDRIRTRGDAEAERVIESAREKGILPKEEPAPAGAPATLSARERRALVQRLGRLLQRSVGQDAYDLIDVRAVAAGGKLLDVKLGHYDGAHLLNTVVGSEMEIFGDVANDTLELRIRGGGFVNPNRVGDLIPFPEGGHSIFLRGIGLKEWVEKSGGSAEVGAEGRLLWK